MGGPGSGASLKKPTALHILQGTARPGRLHPYEPMPKPIAPPMPVGLGPIARRTWKRLAPILEGLGLLAETDGERFAALVSAWERYVRASRRLREAETFCRARRKERASTRGGFRRVDLSLEIAQIRTAEVPVERAEHAFRVLATEFGLSPAARGRLNVQPLGRSEEDFEEYLQGGKSSAAPGPNVRLRPSGR